MISERRDLEYNLPLSSSSSCVSVSSTSTTGTSTTTLLRRVNSSGYLNKNINTQQKDNIDQLYYNSNHEQEPEEDYDLEGGLDRGHEVTEDEEDDDELLYYDKRPTYYSYFDVEDNNNNNNNNNNRRYCCDLTRGARKSELFLISVKIAQIYMYFSLVAVAFLLFIAFLFHKQPFFITGLCSTSYLDVTNQNTNSQQQQQQSRMSDKVQFALSNAVKGAFAYFITYLFCLYYIHRGEHMIIQLQRYLRELQQQKRQTTSNNNNNNNTRWSLLFLLPWRFIEKWRWRYSRGYNTTFIRTGNNTYYNNDEEKELCPIVYNSYVNDKDRTSPFRRKGTNSSIATAAGGGVMMRNTPSSTSSTKKRKKGKKSGSRIHSHTNNNNTDTILPLSSSSSHSDVGAKKYAYGTFQFWKQANTSSDIKGNYKDKHR